MEWQGSEIRASFDSWISYGPSVQGRKISLLFSGDD